MSKVLLITGGASGIGAETARLAARQGYKVAINYRSRDAQAMGIAADIAAQNGEAIALPGDMASEADIVRMFEETTKALGPLTHLLNSAGISRQIRVDEYDAQMLATLFATMTALAAFLHRGALRARRAEKILRRGSMRPHKLV